MFRNTGYRTGLVALLCLLSQASAALAQTEPATTFPTKTAPATGETLTRDIPEGDSAGETTTHAAGAVMSYKNLLDILRGGGPVMFPLFACSFLTVMFVFERTISLRRGRVIPRPFVKRFLHQVGEGKLDRETALDLCLEKPSPVADVFAAAVRKWGRPSVEIEQTVIDAGDRASNGLRRYLRVFHAVATISPLLGLLGTVFGMIRLFNEISTADAMGRTELLAAGISEALLTTAAGLLIASPALCFYLYFVGRIERLLTDIDGHGQQLVALISAEALHDDRPSKVRTRSRPSAAA